MRAAQRSTLLQHPTRLFYRRSILRVDPAGSTCPAEAARSILHTVVVPAEARDRDLLVVRLDSSLAAVVVGSNHWVLEDMRYWVRESLRAGSMGQHRGELAAGR